MVALFYQSHTEQMLGINGHDCCKNRIVKDWDDTMSYITGMIQCPTFTNTTPCSSIPPEFYIFGLYITINCSNDTLEIRRTGVVVIDSTQFVAVGMITHTIVANDDRFLSFGMHINKSNWEAFPFPDTILSSVYHTGPPEH